MRACLYTQELVRIFNFHQYDNLKHTAKKLDPLQRRTDAQGQQVVTLLFGAYNGDMTALRRCVGFLPLPTGYHGDRWTLPAAPQCG